MQEVILYFTFVKLLHLEANCIIANIVLFDICVIVLNHQDVLLGGKQPKHADEVTEVEDQKDKTNALD
jgi:hypothetical protein